ncbi:MAG: hypothetical protein ACYCOU_11520 [Sulfobacillus sp.]
MKDRSLDEVVRHARAGSVVRLKNRRWHTSEAICKPLTFLAYAGQAVVVDPVTVSPGVSVTFDGVKFKVPGRAFNVFSQATLTVVNAEITAGALAQIYTGGEAIFTASEINLTANDPTLALTASVGGRARFLECTISLYGVFANFFSGTDGAFVNGERNHINTVNSNPAGSVIYLKDSRMDSDLNFVHTNASRVIELDHSSYQGAMDHFSSSHAAHGFMLATNNSSYEGMGNVYTIDHGHLFTDDEASFICIDSDFRTSGYYRANFEPDFSLGDMEVVRWSGTGQTATVLLDGCIINLGNSLLTVTDVQVTGSPAAWSFNSKGIVPSSANVVVINTTLP